MKIFYTLLAFISIILFVSPITSLQISPPELTFFKDGECEVIKISSNETVKDIHLIIYGTQYEFGNSADWFSLSNSHLTKVSYVPQEVAVCLDKPCCLGDREYRASLLIGKIPVQLKVLPESSGLNYLWWAIGVVLLIAVVKHI